MARMPKPFTVRKRNDSRTFQVTLNPSCGLPARMCREWTRRSFQELLDELACHRNPRTKTAAEAAALALIKYLGKRQEEGSARRVTVQDITIGGWIEKFTQMESSPRTGVNASRNRPYSPGTVDTYRSYFVTHIEGDVFCSLKMAEVEEEDALEFVTRLSVKKLADGRPMSGRHRDALPEDEMLRLFVRFTYIISILSLKPLLFRMVVFPRLIPKAVLPG